MGLIDTIRGWGRKASPEQRARTTGTTSAGTSLLLGGTSAAQRPRDYASYLASITISNVYACASVIANNFAATPLRILDDDENEVDVEHDAPLLHNLLTQPNPMMRGRKFRQFLCYDLLLCGNSYTALDNMTGLSQPTEMYRLSPAKVRIQRNEDGSLTYLYDVQIDRSTTKTISYAQNEIIHIATADPRDPTGLYGIGVIESGLTSFDADRRINELIYNYFDRGGVVSGVLQTEQNISEEDRRQIISDWKAQAEGSRRWRTALLWQGAKYTPVAEPLGSLNVTEIAKLSLDSICHLFGCPKQLLGDFQESNYRNSQEASAFFHSETLQPLLDLVNEDGWNTLVPLFGPYHSAYDHKDVTDYQMKAESTQRLAETGAFTVNDLRVSAGYEPLPEEEELGTYIPLPKGMSLLSPEQAESLGASAQAAPEDQPAAPVVTELAGSAAPAPLPAAAAQQPAQAPGAAPSAGRGGKSMRYPDGLLSRGARAEQRRKRLVRHAPDDGPRLLPATGSKALPRRVTVSAKPEGADVALVSAAYGRWAEEADAHLWDAAEDADGRAG